MNNEIITIKEIIASFEGKNRDEIIEFLENLVKDN